MVFFPIVVPIDQYGPNMLPRAILILTVLPRAKDKNHAGCRT